MLTKVHADVTSVDQAKKVIEAFKDDDFVELTIHIYVQQEQ